MKATTPSDVVGVVNNNVGVKRFLHSGHSVDDEFMEGTVTPGHLISPEGGNDHKIAMTSELQLSNVGPPLLLKLLKRKSENDVLKKQRSNKVRPLIL